MSFFLISLLIISIMPRLSLVPDWLFKTFLHYDMPDRLSTKILLVLWFIAFAIYTFKNRKSVIGIVKQWVVNNQLISTSLGIAIMLFAFTLPFSTNKDVSLTGVVYYLMLIFVGVFIASYISKKAYFRIVYVASVLSIINVILSIIALAQFLLYLSPWTDVLKTFNYGGFMPITYFVIRSNSQSILRPSSLMIDPNFFGAYLSITILFIIHTIRKYDNTSTLKYGLAFSVFALLLTFSRTGIAMLLIGLLMYGVAYFSKNLRIKNKNLSILPFIGSFLQRFWDGLTLKDSSSLSHLEFASEGLKMFRDNLVGGVGIGNYTSYYHKFIDKKVGTATPHSTYIRVLAEMGLLGLIAHIFVLVTIFIKLISKQSYIFLVLLLMLLAGNLTYDFLMTPFAWVIIGIIISDIPSAYGKICHNINQ